MVLLCQQGESQPLERNLYDTGSPSFDSVLLLFIQLSQTLSPPGSLCVDHLILTGHQATSKEGQKQSDQQQGIKRGRRRRNKGRELQQEVIGKI